MQVGNTSNSTGNTYPILLNPLGGNVGIGTTSPSQKLNVNGSIGLPYTGYLLSTTDVGNKIELHNGSGIMNFYTNGSTRLSIAYATGNVGIGTTSPNQSAAASSSTVVSTKAKTSGGVAITELIGLANNDNDKAGLITFISQNATSPLASIRGLRYTSDTTGKLAFFTSGTEKMRIDYNGNVGIGTDNPEAKLHVYSGNASIAPNADGDELVVENSGNAGISILSGNTSNGAVLFGDAQDSNVGIIDYDHNTNSMSFTTGASTGLTIDSSQRVGINVTNPNEKLQVDGNIRLNGSVYFSSSSVFNKILLNGTDMEIWSGALFPSIDITSAGLLKFGAYALGGAGTPTKLLGVDGSGNVVTTAAGGGGASSLTGS
jgi:hypothetical protein